MFGDVWHFFALMCAGLDSPLLPRYFRNETLLTLVTMSNGLNIELYENVFEYPEEVFKRLEEEISYLPSDLKLELYGKTYSLPRQIAAYGDEDLSYTFSGLYVSCEPWTPTLVQIKQLVENMCGETFNFVLVNRYKDGNSCVGQHKENGKNLNAQSAIASVSFGQTRTMIFKKPDCANHTVELKDNSVLIMRPPTNDEWTHGIPRQRNCNGVRINLTFCNIIKESKRKATEELDPGNHKKNKGQSVNNSACFFEYDIPDTLFDLGDCVFLRVVTFLGLTSLHLRRYKKYGSKMYPTAEGVTLYPQWIESIFGRKQVPQNENDMPGDLLLPKTLLQIKTLDFVHFTFCRKEKAITITKQQWENAIDMYDSLSTLLADEYYQSLNFGDIYCEIYDTCETASSSMDNEYGTQYLMRVLFQSMCKVLCLEEPDINMEKVLGNKICAFNNRALSLDLSNLANEFYENLMEEQSFLELTKLYVSQYFLKQVCLKKLLQQARDHFCPGYSCTDY